MNHRTLEGIFEQRLTRRTVLERGGVLGLSALLAAGAIKAVGAQGAAPAALNSYPEVVITAANYKFDIPATIAGGWTRLTLRNQGTDAHHAMFLRLNKGETADSVIAAAKADPNAIFTKVTSIGGPASIDPGRQSTVIANLEPGNYLVICAIPGADGMPHYAMGMLAPITVTAPPSPGTAPKTDGTVKLVDFGFGQMPMELAAESHIWEVANVGSQLHELVILQLAPGITFDQVKAMLAAETAPPATPAAASTAPTAPAEAGPPPVLAVAGVAPISPGQTNWAVLTLEAADHVALCFIPDSKTGAPHAALGMVMPFTVK